MEDGVVVRCSVQCLNEAMLISFMCDGHGACMLPRVSTWSVPAAVVMTNYEKSEDRLSENVKGVKEAKIVKARDTLDVTLYCWSPCLA